MRVVPIVIAVVPLLTVGLISAAGPPPADCLRECALAASAVAQAGSRRSQPKRLLRRRGLGRAGGAGAGDAAPTTQPAAPVPTSQPHPAASTPPTSQPAAGGMAPLKIKLPKPAFAGTPKHIPPGTTVQKPSGKPRPPFLAPAGVRNLARGRPVTASDAEPIIGELPLVTDGDKEAGAGRYVELGPMRQHVQIDLGQTVEIFAVLLWHYHRDPRVYHDVVVQVADDAEFRTNVRTLFNNDHDNSAGLGVGKDREYFETFEGRLVPGRREKARYVRLYSNGSTASEMNHYTEVEVHGLPAK